MTKKLKVGMIGCGGIAVSKHIPSLAKIQSVELAAFCDADEGRARRIAVDFGAPEAAIYTDYKELLRDETIDVVHICTPNASHAEVSLAALAAGKHVNCEKPMAKTGAEARAMYAASLNTDKKLTISYQNRFRPDSQFLYKACRSGQLGEIYFAKAHAIRRRAVPTWGAFLDKDIQGGGPLIDIGTHALDLTLWMMDNYKPKVVLGRAFHELSKKENAANAWGPWDPSKFTVEDSAFGMIVMENGATVILESSWALNTLDVKEAKCTLSGTEGGADMEDGLRLNGEQYGRTYTQKIDMATGGIDFYDNSADNAADLEMRLWIDSILTGTDPIVKPKEALVVSEILEAIYESSETGKAIYFN
jgi:predicted dehydrogenase